MSIIDQLTGNLSKKSRHAVRKQDRMDRKASNGMQGSEGRYTVMILPNTLTQETQANTMSQDSPGDGYGAITSVTTARPSFFEKFLPLGNEDEWADDEYSQHIINGCHPKMIMEISNDGAGDTMTTLEPGQQAMATTQYSIEGSNGSPETNGRYNRLRIRTAGLVSSGFQAFGTFAASLADAFSGQSGNPFTPAPGKNEIFGEEFTAGGVRYLSMPASDAAANALSLYNSAVAAGMPKLKTEAKEKWEATPAGRAWIRNNIYLPVIKMNSKSNDEAMADYYAKNLASKPDKESYWSSWFFRACYISHWNKDSSQRTLGMHQSTIFDYSADEGLGARQLIEADPDKYKDQIVFVTFQDEEAPLFPGDATYAIREKGNKSFSAIPGNRGASSS